MEILWILGAIVLVVFLLKFKLKHTQNIGNLTMVTGGVKAGKSTVSVYLANRRVRKARAWWKLRRIWAKCFHLEPPEEPLLYSNVPIAVSYYTPLKKEHIEKLERFNYKSVIYIQEASLLADCMTFKDAELNECTLEFFKLIGHETRGGYLVADTQCPEDVHFNLKRSLSTVLYVHRTFRWCPFLLFVKVQERMYDASKSTINVNTEGDVDEMQYRWLVFTKRNSWRLFDRYCYSILTDHLPATGEGKKPDSLKANDILTFRKGKRDEVSKKARRGALDSRDGTASAGADTVLY